MRRGKAILLVGAFLAFAFAGAAAADAWQYRHALALLQEGRVNEAGAAFGRLRLLKTWALPRIEAMAKAAPNPEAGAPLWEALARLQPKPERWQTAVAMRRAALDPQRLRLEGGLSVGPWPPALMPSPPPGPMPPAQLLSTPTEDAPSDWGHMVRLSLRDASDQSHEVGSGFEGPVGRSWSFTPDGLAVWVAQDQSLERLEFSDGRMAQQVRTQGAPQFLATAPEGPPRLLFTLAGAGGDSLMLLEGSSLRSLYPGPGAAPPTWLAAAWAPDGNSVLMWWPDAPPTAPGQRPDANSPPGGGGTHVAWLRVQDGHLGMEATVEVEAVNLVPHWAIASDGAMGLGVDDAVWVWEPKSEKAKPVPEVGRVWGFDPSGRLIASLSGQSLTVLDWRRPERQTRIPLPIAAASFAAAPAALKWEGGKPERLSVPSVRGGTLLQFALGIVPLGLGASPLPFAVPEDGPASAPSGLGSPMAPAAGLGGRPMAPAPSANLAPSPSGAGAAALAPNEPSEGLGAVDQPLASAPPGPWAGLPPYGGPTSAEATGSASPEGQATSSGPLAPRLAPQRATRAYPPRRQP